MLDRRWLPVFFTVTGIVSVSPGETERLRTEEVICWLKFVSAWSVVLGSAGTARLEDCCSVVGELQPEEKAVASTTRKR